MHCSWCAAEAVVDLPYRQAHACSRHLARSVEERFRVELARQLPRGFRGILAVALSGGKDSSVALALTHQALRRRPGIRLLALSVDEGIEGYRPPTLAAATALTEALGVEHRIVRAADELGTTTDRSARERPGLPPCSYCGVWRRGLLNRAARDAGAGALVLGFNLDDLAQTVLMNLVRGDLNHLLRMAPHRRTQPGLVPRLAPLAQVPEREVYLYAREANLPFDHGECPYAGRALRNRFRAIVWDLEEAHPGTRQALLRTHRRLAALLESTGEVGAPERCVVCGEPSGGRLCRGCELLGVRKPSLLPSEAA